MEIGYKLSAEGFGPRELMDQAVDAGDIRGQFACGPDVAVHVQAVESYLRAGFDRVVLQNVGPDPDGFFDFFERELAEAIRRSPTTDGSPS